MPALRLAALQIVAQRAPERALPVIKRFAASKSAVEQQAAFQAMGQLQPPQAPALLVSAIDQLAAGKVLPAAQVELLETRPEEHGADGQGALGEAAGGLGRQQRSTRGLCVCARGRRSLAGLRAVHREPGPALLTLPQGRRRRRRGRSRPVTHRCAASPSYLLESVVKPSAHIAPGFDNVTFHAGERRDRDRQPGQRVRDADRAQARRWLAGDAGPQASQEARGGAVFHARDLRPDAHAQPVARRGRVPAPPGRLARRRRRRRKVLAPPIAPCSPRRRKAPPAAIHSLEASCTRIQRWSPHRSLTQGLDIAHRGG